jgi:hypothetical protein
MNARAASLITLVHVVAVMLLAKGCAAIPIAALGASALEAGAGAVVKTGTEYTMSGAAHRTFTIPLQDVHVATLAAFDRAGVTVARDEPSKQGRRIVGRADHRSVNVRLMPLTPVLTSMTLIVKRNLLVKDRATTSELLEQIEQVLADNPAYARRLRREREGSAAASPGS